ncbi:hypothetical protein [Brevibacterium sp. LS14]|uniref:hypothetical protein n=1 Tax=Brevibacterium sp. LS14 TaxID=2528962 RepID=UPI00142FE73C
MEDLIDDLEERILAPSSTTAVCRCAGAPGGRGLRSILSCQRRVALVCVSVAVTDTGTAGGTVEGD